MPGGIYNGVQRKIKIDENVLLYMQQADIRIATLESAIGNKETFINEKVSRLGDLVYSKDEPCIHIGSYFTIIMAILCVDHYRQ